MEAQAKLSPLETFQNAVSEICPDMRLTSWSQSMTANGSSILTNVQAVMRCDTSQALDKTWFEEKFGFGFAKAVKTVDIDMGLQPVFDPYSYSSSPVFSQHTHATATITLEFNPQLMSIIMYEIDKKTAWKKYNEDFTQAMDELLQKKK